MYIPSADLNCVTYLTVIDQSDREIYGLDGLDSEDELSDDDIAGKNEEDEEIDGSNTK